MTFTSSVKTCFSKYFTFSGRASRSEFWWFVLFIEVVAIILMVIDAALFGADAADPETGWNYPVISLFRLATFLPLLAAGWRRLHDTGRPGRYLLLPLLLTLVFLVILVIGVSAIHEHSEGAAAGFSWIGLGIYLIVQGAVALLMIWWLTRPSEIGENQYGPPPE